MKVSTRLAAIGAASLAGLVVGYGVVFCFYVAGLFGDGSHVPARLWEKALRGTILLGPFVAGFLLLGFLAWREKWSTGLVPWAAGLVAVLVLARKDAGILTALDSVWAVLLLVIAARARTRPADDGGDVE